MDEPSFKSCPLHTQILCARLVCPYPPDHNTALVWRFNPLRHRPFRILPRHTGVGTTPPPRAVLPLIDLELREKKNERLPHRETKRLVYKLTVPGQPVTSEVRSSVEK